MNVSIGPRWESFIESIVAEGRYASADAVMREGLRLVEEREQKMKALRETIENAIERGGSYSSDDVRDAVDEALDDWEARRRA
ncbi:type II toxin-antitoxin system ParD family antitoxin [Sphingomonas sp. PAMC 26621]|uniref:type II toxin-antitoxin system ParD family antitoxin n=1 Tax=Sphingomonas sp. PAMC 26621 TaxID=1112213 RepID=UPI0002882699|nr:type II toxin-antitoxin system ParD family antitoxin [Sphingomonas sp. PAMC 26621]